MSKRVLVTGGAGFIGSALCLRLVDQGWTVTNLDVLTYAAAPASLAALDGHERYTLVKADIRDAGAVKAAFETARPDAVMHLAAESHVDRSITGAGIFVDTNVMGTFTLLEAARAWRDSLPADKAGAFRFLHVSTDEVFGSLGAEGLFCETTAYDPSSPYSASKAASDHLARAWGRTYGLNILVSNCSNNYGPRQFPEKLIPLMILNALAGKDLPVYGDGSNVRDWLFVDDHARALIDIVERGRAGETYCIGGNAERTNLDVVQAICDIVDDRRPGGVSRRELIRFVTDRPGHDARYAIDSSRLQDELGWSPSLDFETGLAQTVDWYLDHEAWWRPIQEGVYRQERLGLPA
ncbi:dTDP-glucose 4,6-dehydratase [Maricaulis virginensis]|uniref:dTDP-glucose 4,6-dehydratase n=1 Tax=Maricaulis virginensis TaxID=144022 RepID=A0A9W6ILU4_9PROT|nr:dTDP-glucose 4,6-dehydratase [Maricaulis virginensis]GLK52668.1 dTDP-glucose 4,6-dehydratase [Maricaulis virginensis]